jgi:hypothetical protein
MAIEFKQWKDVKEDDWVLHDGRILQVKTIDPTDWDQSRNYGCSSGFAHEHNINDWTAVTDRLPSHYKPPTWDGDS